MQKRERRTKRERKITHTHTQKKDLLGGESNPGQPGDSRLYLTTILPKISYFYAFALSKLKYYTQKQTNKIIIINGLEKLS